MSQAGGAPPSRDKMEPRHGIMKAFPKVKRAKALHGKDALPTAKKKPNDCDVTGSYCVCERVTEICKHWFLKMSLKLCKRNEAENNIVINSILAH